MLAPILMHVSPVMSGGRGRGVGGTGFFKPCRLNRWQSPGAHRVCRPCACSTSPVLLALRSASGMMHTSNAGRHASGTLMTPVAEAALTCLLGCGWGGPWWSERVLAFAMQSSVAKLHRLPYQEKSQGPLLRRILSDWMRMRCLFPFRSQVSFDSNAPTCLLIRSCKGIQWPGSRRRGCSLSRP